MCFVERRAFVMNCRRNPELPSPLYVICDSDVCARAGWTMADFAAACMDGGATLFQVRAKHASSAELLDRTEAILARGAAANVTVIVNDRADPERDERPGPERPLQRPLACRRGVRHQAIDRLDSEQ